MTWRPTREELNVLRNELSLGQTLTKAMHNEKVYTIKIFDNYIDMQKNDRFIGRLYIENPDDIDTIKIDLENEIYEDKAAFSVLIYLMEHYIEHVKSNDLLGGLF